MTSFRATYVSMYAKALAWPSTSPIPSSKPSAIGCAAWRDQRTFTRSGISEMKAFLSRYRDVLRLPYARTASKFARRTMFMGTVNDYDCLRDGTGNRRYMPIVARNTLNWDEDEIDQLWAEAWRRYRARGTVVADRRRTDNS